MIVYAEIPKNIQKITKISEYKNLFYLYILLMNNWKLKLKKGTTYSRPKKHEILYSGINLKHMSKILYDGIDKTVMSESKI